MRALVVFHDRGNHWADFLLKRGFRHVLVAIDDGRCWIEIDPKNGTPEITVVTASDFDLADWYRQHGFTVVTVNKPEESPLRWPMAWANCVGVVKFVLGIRDSLIVTPYQLYRRLAC